MNITDFTIDLAKKAGKLILKEEKKGFKIELKSEKDFVTNIDTETEKFIIKEIKKAFPTHAILGEESDFQNLTNQEELNSSPYIWIIDPLDGTNNFVHGIPHFAVSIAVFKTQKKENSKNYKYFAGELVTGVIYDPNNKELFYAEKDKGAFLNENRLNISNVKELNKSLIGIDFPADNSEENLDLYTTLVDHSQAIRRMGSGALTLAYLAAGRLDAVCSFGLKAWDIAAGLLLIKEAGGQITDTHGNLIDLFGQDLLCTNSHLHTQIIKLLN